MNNEEINIAAADKQPRRAVVDRIMRHQFIAMLSGAVLIALCLVAVSLSLYVSSGTLQLDLSRPGYDVARKEAYDKNKEVFRGFSSNGPVDKAVLDEFDKLYVEKTKNISIKAFSGSALSDRALGLEVAE